MSSNLSDYSEYTLHNTIVNFLKEDGALCDASAKTYDINGTAEGGEGGRLAFKKINDKINNYHDILKFLSGEERANIYENIPVIDYVHKENTGFLEKYYSDESGLYSMMIEDVPLRPNTQDIDLLKERDPYTLNRALAGLTMSEHFYNTSGKEISDLNIQTEIPDTANPDYIYKGVKSFRNPVPNVSNISSTYYPTITMWRISQSSYIYFNDATSAPEIPTPTDNNSHKYVDDEGHQTSEYVMNFRDSKTYILNTAIRERFFIDASGDTTRHPYQFRTYNNEFLVSRSDSGSEMYFKLKLNKDDLLILIPSTSYSQDTNKFILITKDIKGSLVSYVLFFNDSVGLPDAYQCMSVYYEDSLPFADLNLEGKELTNFVNVLSIFLTLKEVFYSDASGLLNGYFCVPKDIEVTSNGRRVSKWEYSKPAGKETSPYFIGKLYDGGELLSRGSMIEEPLKLTSHDRVISYTRGGGTTTIIGPDALRAAGYSGKAEVYYQNLLNRDSIFVNAFSSEYDFSDWVRLNNSPIPLYNVLSFTDIERATGEISENTESYSLGKGIFGKIIAAFKKLISRAVSTSRVKYSKKLKGNISYDLITNYIENFSNALQPINADEVKLVLKERSNSISAYETTTQRRFLSFLIGDRKTGSYEISEDVLGTYFNAVYHISYNMRTKNKNKPKVFSVKEVKMISPYELFLPTGEQTPRLIYDETEDYYYEEWDPNPILLYPSKDSEFPFSMILMSRTDILNDGDVVSFWNNDLKRYLMMEVDSKLSCTPSKITKVNYNGPEMESGNIINETGSWSPTYEKLLYRYIEEDIDENDDDEGDDDDSNGRGSRRTRVKRVRRKELEQYTIVDKSHDCYIYTLTSKKIEFNESNLGVSFYDNEDNKIRIDSDLFSGYMIPTVNNKDYFTLKEKDNKDLNKYYLKDGASNVSSLRSSAIIRKMPKLVNAKGYTGMKALKLKQGEIRSASLKDFYGAFLDSYKDEDNKGQFLAILNNLYRYLLGSLKVSDSNDNPLYFREVRKILENLNALIPLLKVALKSGMQVNGSEGVKVITLADIKNLEDRAHRQGIYRRSSFDIKSSSVVSDPNNIQWEYKEVESGHIADDKITYYINNNGVFTPMSPQPTPGVEISNPYGIYIRDFTATVLRALENIEVIQIESSESHEWATFDQMISALTTYDLEMNPDCAKDLDKYFGSGTYPFIRMSQDNSSNNAIMTLFSKKYEDAVENVIYIIGKEYQKSFLDMGVLKLKNDYKKYFTSSTVESAIDSNGDIDDSKLTLDLGTESSPNTYIEEIFKRVWNSYSLKAFILPFAWRKDIHTVMTKLGFYGNGIWNALSRIFLDPLKKEILNSLKDSRDVFNESYPNRFKKDSVHNYLRDDDNIDDNDTMKLSVEGSKFVIDIFIPGMGSDYTLVRSSDSRSRITLFDYKYSQVDIERSVFESILEYVKYALSGVDETTSNATTPAAGIEMTSEKNIPRMESLYGIRYKILNSRMNRLDGPLWNAAFNLMSSSYFNDSRKTSNSILDSYSMYANVLPIAKMNRMTYLPAREASMTSVPLKGKYYSDEEMESLRNLINSQCVLTCTKCNVKESCPFYDQKEVIDMTCTPMESIDIYLKDNELELIVEDSVEIQKGKSDDSSTPEGTYFDLDSLKNKHLEYGEILAKKTNENKLTYDVVNIAELNKELVRTEGLGYNDFVSDEMRWVLGGRYGTVEYNGTMKKLLVSNYPELEESIPLYKLCYDALFIKITGNDNSNIDSEEDRVPYMMEDSYIGYRDSANAYPVSYELGRRGNKKKYNVKAKIKIPAYIKMLNDADPSDDVYLVSDDTKDLTGKPIDPVIYLGKVRDLQYTFDIIEDDPEMSKGVMNPDDVNVYASDVAQWCINYMKGHCTEDPVGEPDEWHNRDQYWMPFVYKELYDEKGRPYWAKFPGRPRLQTGYQEPVIDVENFDEISAISGKPVINTYYDFVRKVSIRIYDSNIADEDSRWLIPWVNPNMPPSISDSSIQTLEEMKEFQRTVLPLMKTNLRLVVIKN